MTAVPVKCTAVERRRKAVSPGYGLAMPAMVAMVILILGPAVAAVAFSLTDWQLGARQVSFIGLANFQELAHDRTFRAALLNTALYAAIVVPVTVVLGLSLAVLIEAGSSLRAVYRAAHFLPVMVTLAAMAIAWEALLHPTIGLVNQGLRAAGFSGANWLRDPATVLPTLAAIGIWQNVGFALVLFLAGLKAIPGDLYHAADIDGADSAIDRFLTVTWPLLGPTTLFVVVIVAIRAFEVFDTVRILTEGGPVDASEVMLYRLYVEGFEYLRTGYAAAITVAFLAIVFALTLLQIRVIERRVHYS